MKNQQNMLKKQKNNKSEKQINPEKSKRSKQPKRLNKKVNPRPGKAKKKRKKKELNIDKGRRYLCPDGRSLGPHNEEALPLPGE